VALQTLARRLAATLLFVCVKASATGWSGDFEQLQFSINWLFFNAGVAIIQAAPVDKSTAELRLEACSNPVLDLIYKVRDQVITSAEFQDEHYRSLQYRYTQEEGGDHSDLSVDFSKPGKITYIDHLEKKKKKRKQVFTTEVPRMDMATAFFRARQFPLKVGKTYSIPVFDKGKQYELVVEVLRKDTIDTILGDDTPTVVIHPRLQTDGFFKRKGEIHIWITDDERHLPVRMTSKVRVGQVVSELTDIVTQPVAIPANGLICEALREQ
jgi:hypothetical protein